MENCTALTVLEQPALPVAFEVANWKHGYYSREAKAERSRVRAAILALRYLRMLGH